MTKINDLAPAALPEHGGNGCGKCVSQLFCGNRIFPLAMRIRKPYILVMETEANMFTAYNQKTMEVIAKGKSRDALRPAAEAACGKFGYIIREEVKAEPLPKNWCTTDGEWWN